MAKNMEIPQGWEYVEFGKIAKLKNKKYKPVKNEIIHCIELQCIEKETSKILYYINSNELKSLKNIFDKGDVLYGKLRPYLRKHILASESGICSSEIWVLENNNIIMNAYLFLLVQSDKFNYVTNISTGSRMPRADWSIVCSYPFLIPPLEEQKKITDILLLWDKAIEKTKELIAEKEKLKKGLMQNLLTGKKRLKGFSDEWKSVRLGEVCEIKTGKMDANAMKSDGAYPFFTCAKEIYNIDTYAFDTEALLISGNGNIGYIHYYNGRFNAYQRTYVLDKFSEYIIFVKYMLDLYLYNRILREKKVGSIPYIVLGTLYDMELSVPISICEQQAISSVLQKADEEIVLLNKQIELYTKQKKGLMQNLLTGKVRVRNN